MCVRLCKYIYIYIYRNKARTKKDVKTRLRFFGLYTFCIPLSNSPEIFVFAQLLFGRLSKKPSQNFNVNNVNEKIIKKTS